MAKEREFCCTIAASSNIVVISIDNIERGKITNESEQAA